MKMNKHAKNQFKYLHTLKYTPFNVKQSYMFNILKNCWESLWEYWNFKRHHSWEMFLVYILLQDPIDRRPKIIIIKTNIFQLQKSNEQMYYFCVKNWTYMVEYRCIIFHWMFSSVDLTRDALPINTNFIIYV